MIELGGSEQLGPRYDGATIDNQQPHAGPGGGITPAHHYDHHVVAWLVEMAFRPGLRGAAVAALTRYIMRGPAE